MPGAFRAAYQDALAAGEIAPDRAQAAAVAALERIEGELAGAGFGGVTLRRRTVMGAYLFGPVGRGKTLLMDLFFAALAVRKKRRVHFHVFMAEVHALARVWREGDTATRRARFGSARGDDPIAPLARKIAAEASVLCFDELQVSDIADAMILGRLFEALFLLGVTVVATSNRAPRDLYRDGINRQLFLPFIAMLEERLEVVPVDGDRDYRLGRLRAAGTWFSPIDPDHERAFDALWLSLLAGRAEEGASLEVLGRRQHWPRASDGMVRAHFASLCVQALGPADYIAIAARFPTVFVEQVPRLRPDMRDPARRFAILTDTLYEARARVVILAAGEPASLYPAGDMAFEFQRAVSRLEEMRSAAWLEEARACPDGE